MLCIEEKEYCSRLNPRVVIIDAYTVAEASGKYAISNSNLQIVKSITFAFCSGACTRANGLALLALEINIAGLRVTIENPLYSVLTQEQQCLL